MTTSAPDDYVARVAEAGERFRRLTDRLVENRRLEGIRRRAAIERGTWLPEGSTREGRHLIERRITR